MNLRKVLAEKPKLAERLFCRGYLFTNKKDIDTNDFPFFANWNVKKIGNYCLYIHKYQKVYVSEYEEKYVIIIGNVINPFSMEYREQKLADELLSVIINDEAKLVDIVNEWTGDYLVVYVNGEQVSFISDPTEMLFCAYGKINEKMYIASHTQLIGDIDQVTNNEYVSRLSRYRYFYKYGVFFPGDLTQYNEIKRAFTNHLYKYVDDFTYKRIYPTENIHEVTTEDEYRALIKSVSGVLQQTMRCAAKKWSQPAISMTGGMDSKTTLAMANGSYEKFYYYSYISMDGDKRDADAAHKIADAIGVDHIIHYVPENDDAFVDIDVIREILQHNNGGYKVNLNDVRKRAYFQNCDAFDVEIKSWVSEVARANYYKKFGLKRMPKRLMPRNMTAMYKVFLTDRALAKQTDKVFKDFIKNSCFDEIPDGYDASDMYLWEFRYSAWGGMVITFEHSYSNEIFIPFNNRKLLDMMLHAPLSKRITDAFHDDLIKYGNSQISDTNITITNWNETKQRMHIERIYYLLSSIFSKF